MEHDIEMVIPVCTRMRSRTEDFKKYGLANTSGRKVLVTLIVSGDEETDGLEEGWPNGVETRVRKNKCPDHVSNLYRFYADLKREDVKSKWIMRLDDDSCNDVGGLLDDLESMYDWEDKFYLGDLNNFECALHAGESHVFSEYKHLLGDLSKIAPMLKNETECGLLSHGAVMHMLGSKKCMDFFRHRADLRGGFGDCAGALAAALAKLYPIQCPLISYLPLVSRFSLFGGPFRHIHMISRSRQGENFGNDSRCGSVQYEALVRRIDNKFTESEKKVSGKRYLLETERELSVYEFRRDRTAKIKFDDRVHVWTEIEGKISLFCEPQEVRISFVPDESGCLVGRDHEDREIRLKPIGTV